METTTVSTKYQVVIPRRIREALGIKPGQRMKVLIQGNSLQFIPVRPIQEYRGIFAGMDNDFERDEDDRV